MNTAIATRAPAREVRIPTSLVAEYYGHPGERGSAALYTGTFLTMSFAFNLLWRYASHNHRLLRRSVTAEQVEIFNRQYLVGPTFYGLAFILAFVNVPASLLLTILLAGFYAFKASTSRKS